MFNLIAWDRRDNTFVEGQWIRKAVQPDRCALSPDGQHFLYAVTGADPATQAGGYYTVISRVPWFTALALFANPNQWDGGGRFLDNTLFQLNMAPPAKDLVGRATDLHAVTEGAVSKDCRTGLRLLNGQPAPLSKLLRDQLLSGEAPAKSDPLPYETEGGCLYRLTADGRKLIRDFTVMEPRFEPAPYSVPPVAEDKQPWHPLDGEVDR
ncbi:MAG: hypothetical protein AAGF56_08885 [Pseudomonadota bacterium]